MSLMKYVTLAALVLSTSSAVAGDARDQGLVGAWQPLLADPMLVHPDADGGFETVDPRIAYQAYIHAINAGDADAAAGLHAEKTHLVAGRLCLPENPCTSRDRVRDSFERWIAMGMSRTIRNEDTQSAGILVVSKIEVRWPGIEDLGISRIVGIDYVEARGGEIVSSTFLPDEADEQTAHYLKIATGNHLF